MRTLIRITYQILDLILHFTLYIIISTWSVTQYPVNTASMLGICTNNFIIPPTDAELMGRCRRKRWIYSHPCLEASPKENLTLTHYMLTAWWLKRLDGLGHYII